MEFAFGQLHRCSWSGSFGICECLDKIFCVINTGGEYFKNRTGVLHGLALFLIGFSALGIALHRLQAQRRSQR